MVRLYCLAFPAALLVLTGSGMAPQPLSLNTALQAAFAHHPSTRVAAARVAGAEAKLRLAGAPPSPTVTVGHSAGKNTGAQDQDVILSQTLEMGDKRHQRIIGARADRETAFTNRNATLLDLTFNVQSAYYEALRADAEREQAQEALTTARTFAEAAQTQFQAGDAARSNVLRSRAELARAERALVTAEADRDNRYAALRSIAGMTDDAPITLTDPLSFTPVNYSVAALQALADQNRPDIRAARSEAAARAAALHGARVETQPDLVFQAVHANIDPTTGGNAVFLGVQMPLFDLGRSRADEDSAKAALEEQQATIDEVVRTARAEVSAAHRSLAAARQAVQSFQAGRLNEARELLEMAQTGYTHGATSYIELLDAQQLYRTEQTEYARALADYNLARCELQRAVGGTLP